MRPTGDRAEHPGGSSGYASAVIALSDRIGKGSGVVMRAMDEHLGRRVVVKLTLVDFEEEPELRERFYREARITGQHRHVVRSGEDKGRPFIVMELLDGVRRDYLRTAAASSIDVKMDPMMQLCDGLQNAHEAGARVSRCEAEQHRVLRDGTLKVLDFGVARLAMSSLTAGLMPDAAPEQARGMKRTAAPTRFRGASAALCDGKAAIRLARPAESASGDHQRFLNWMIA